MEKTNEEKLQQVFELIKPIVKRIEDRPASTRNHYGDYLAILGMYGQTAEDRTKMAAVLIKCGANEQGVTDALRLSK